MYNQNMKEKTPKEYWEQIEKENEYIMRRMHPATLVPGFLVGIMV